MTVFLFVNVHLLRFFSNQIVHLLQLLLFSANDSVIPSIYFPDHKGFLSNFPFRFCQVDSSAMVSITSQCSAIFPFSTRNRS